MSGADAEQSSSPLSPSHGDGFSSSSIRQGSLNESQVHDVVRTLKKHSKRHQKDLEALEDAYHEKCQEVWLLSQQLQAYVNRYGTLEEVEQMNEALTEDNDLSLEEEEDYPIQDLNSSIEAHDNEIQEVIKEEDNEDALLEDHPVQSLSEARPRRADSLDTARPLSRSADDLPYPSLDIAAPNLPEEGTPERGDFAIVPVEDLTKSQKKRHDILMSQQSQLGHQWTDRKKSKISLSRSKGLFTVYNRTGITIYVSVYDKRRVGVGKHVRISPVYCIEGRQISFEKPFARSTRTRWLLFCRDSVHFDESSLVMNPSLFRNIPSYSIDVVDDVAIYLEASSALKATSRMNWKTRGSRDAIQRTTNSFRSSLRGNSGQSELKTEEPGKISHVRKGTDLAPEENEFLSQRENVTRAALEQILGQSLEGHYVPRIAFCGSGGGCRAMVSTLGSLIASELSGLLDCFTYVAGVSGSTWTIGLWESLALTPSQLRENLIAKFEANLITRPSKRGTGELAKMLRSNWSNKQKDHLISLIDIYGAALSTGLLGDTTPKGSKFKLHHQIPRVVNGAFPLPIYTAVQKDVGSLHSWFEFTPFEVGCTDFESFVPSWGFGRSYNLDGDSTDLSPDPPLGTLLATFGSAFCAPLGRVAEEFFDKLEHGVQALVTEDEEAPPGTPNARRVKDSNFKATLLEHKDQLDNLINKMSLANSKIAAPAKFHNFGFDPSKEASKQRKSILELADAGIECNLPFAPLLRPERQVDIIIACNASKSPNIDRSRALRV